MEDMVSCVACGSLERIKKSISLEGSFLSTTVAAVERNLAGGKLKFKYNGT
jgi:predicted nucleic-acid-binding Zn-ribbon protein